MCTCTLVFPVCELYPPVCVCVRACVRACMRVRAYVCVCVVVAAAVGFSVVPVLSLMGALIASD